MQERVQQKSGKGKSSGLKSQIRKEPGADS